MFLYMEDSRPYWKDNLNYTEIYFIFFLSFILDFPVSATFCFYYYY